ncbi:XF1762 family protein [Spongiactinospora gelatinilytica]|uniref:XF1762 family protein n=1 Tax=Spongiactinospora gelatinilytica TaxID=2666298 RepID=UPI0018F5CF55|nr:XF1762 family protein [Spongiactinospora gelatinilytica]
MNSPSAPGRHAAEAHPAVRQRLVIVPLAIRTARAFVAWQHRHLGPPPGAMFAIGVTTPDTTLVGVAIIGRPTARAFDDGFTAEVTRLATDGTPNACSALLGAAWRAARAMGYRRLITYTRAREPGTSLHAAGYRRVTIRPRAFSSADGIQWTLWEITAAGLGGGR